MSTSRDLQRMMIEMLHKSPMNSGSIKLHSNGSKLWCYCESCQLIAGLKTTPDGAVIFGKATQEMCKGESERKRLSLRAL